MERRKEGGTEGGSALSSWVDGGAFQQGTGWKEEQVWGGKENGDSPLCWVSDTGTFM